ncbi:ester cyclase [Myxococcus sp. AM009]|uniref:ester cyclase n=1 Tax=unclassified Myxococcus TaxID=2648731 RepID=UPI001595C4F8|nr:MULTISPECIES: ester cyclase [unclassified Myxococcus]NVI96831.1 ester cyclase [Myxococcus sp. AM009]NVJ15712.1 ester cyclase [Myxococcus sp. AM010]
MTRHTTILLFALGWLSGCATLSPVERAAALEAQNKQRVRQLTEELYNLRKLDRIPEFIAEDFVDRSQGAPLNAVGPAFIRQQAEASFQTFPELRFDILHLIADGDLVLVHWKATGPDPQQVDAAGEPQALLLQGHSLYRLRDGKVVESWDISDRLSPLLQRGYKVVPPTL